MAHYDNEREAEMESEQQYCERKYNETNDPTYLIMLESINARK